MPELPEVESLRRSIDPIVCGATIERIVLGQFTGCIASPPPETFRSQVEGRRVTGTDRRAKYLLLRLDSGGTIAIHLRMTGNLAVADPPDPAPAHHHLTFVLSDGHELRFTDTRKFGRLRLLSPGELSALDAALGPEPLDPALTGACLHRMLAHRRRAIKALLLEQSFIAGIGNIYADEALFAARINPLRPADSLSLDEASRLLAVIQEILRAAIDRRGTTLRDYRDGFGRTGSNQDFLQIYDHQAGEPCPRCGAEIERIVVAQRGTRYCPRCQPRPDRPGR